jgi:hypothetical protein
MPTILRIGPYRFYCYAGDRDEPPHVHVEREDMTVKFWLRPIRLARSRGFARHELARIEKILIEHREELLEAWHDYFGR